MRQIEVPDGLSFPPFSQRRDFTGYKQLRKSSQGRKQLKDSGYIVRRKSATMGAPAKTRRAEYRRETSKFITSDFIGWDGEGVNYRGRHNYVLLQNSAGYCISTESSVGKTGLPTSVCLDFLLETASQNPNAYHVIFAGHYDCNKILKDIGQSPYRLRKLYDTCFCHWEHYKIEWVPHKWLWVKDIRTGQTVKLFDVFSFFQMSFVKTLQKWDIVVPDMATIEEMKQKRGEFDWASQKELIEQYCGLELQALVLLMEEFRRNHLEAGLPLLQGWYGPGAIANGLLRRHSIKRAMLETPVSVNDAALHAFAAGRIERLLYGNYEQQVTILDINSAYPYSISRLPDLHGGWQLIKSKDPVYPLRTMSLYHVRLYHHDKYASPLFFRKHNDDMFFPNPQPNKFIETWVWTPEYYQLVKWKFPHECLECYLFMGKSKTRPFAFVEELYYKRLAWKEAGNPAEKNLKLAINSIYGKTVQQAGFEHHHKIPIYHQIEWGGFITSSTRAQLHDAMAQLDYQNIVGVETDSIIIAGDVLPKEITLSTDLGAWGVTEYEGITYIQSGVYWLKKDGQWLDNYSKGRGYVAGSLKRDAVMEAWSINPHGDSLVVDENSQALGMKVMAQGNEFITLGHCYRPGQDLTNWGNWEVGPKKLSLWRTTKREIVRDSDPRFGLLKTVDQTDMSGWSKKYDIIWGKDNGSNPT